MTRRRPRRTDLGIPTVPAVPLPDAAAKLFDRYTRAKERARKLREAEEEYRTAGDQLEKLFGTAEVGKTESGRILMRIPKSRSYKALPARTLEYSEFHEVPAFALP